MYFRFQPFDQGEGVSGLFSWASRMSQLPESVAYKPLQDTNNEFPQTMHGSVSCANFLRRRCHTVSTCKSHSHWTVDNDYTILKVERHFTSLYRYFLRYHLIFALSAKLIKFIFSLVYFYTNTVFVVIFDRNRLRQSAVFNAKLTRTLCVITKTYYMGEHAYSSHLEMLKSYLSHDVLSPMTKTSDVLKESKWEQLRHKLWLSNADLSTRHPSVTVAPVLPQMLGVVDRMANGEQVQPQESMRYEMLRFRTFEQYPRANKPFLTRFAKAGFYYAGNDDEVICYVCRKRVSHWTEDDNPVEVHKKLSPSCRFVTNRIEGNVPIGSSSNDGHTETETTNTGGAAASSLTHEYSGGACGTSNDVQETRNERSHHGDETVKTNHTYNKEPTAHLAEFHTETTTPPTVVVAHARGNDTH